MQASIWPDRSLECCQAPFNRSNPSRQDACAARHMRLASRLEEAQAMGAGYFDDRAHPSLLRSLALPPGQACGSAHPPLLCTYLGRQLFGNGPRHDELRQANGSWECSCPRRAPNRASGRTRPRRAALVFAYPGFDVVKEVLGWARSALQGTRDCKPCSSPLHDTRSRKRGPRWHKLKEHAPLRLAGAGPTRGLRLD